MFAWMGLSVMFELIGIVVESLVTVVTSVRPLASVNVHVVSVSQLVAEPFLADTTLKGHVSHSCVLLQHVLL